MAISPRQRFLVLQRDGFACRYCGRKAPDVELAVDHVIPRSRGGLDLSSNLVTACVECNAGKGNLLLAESFETPEIAAWSRAEAFAATRAAATQLRAQREAERVAERVACMDCGRSSWRGDMVIAFTRPDGGQISAGVGYEYRASVWTLCPGCARHTTPPQYGAATQADARWLIFHLRHKVWLTGPLSCADGLEAALQHMGFEVPARGEWLDGPFLARQRRQGNGVVQVGALAN